MHTDLFKGAFDSLVLIKKKKKHVVTLTKHKCKFAGKEVLLSIINSVAMHEAFHLS